MKKIIAGLLLMAVAITVNAQKLENKIPKNADIVVTARGARVFDLISMTELNNSAFGEMVLKNANRRKETKRTSLEEMGFKLKKNAYYFLQNTDSVTYHGFAVELADRVAFEGNFNSYKREKIKQINGYSVIKGYSGDITIWNDNLLMFINGEINKNYVKNNRERLEELTGEDSSYRIRKELGKKWTQDKTFNFLNLVPSQTLATSVSFQKAKAKDAVMTLWLRNYGSLMNSIVSSFQRELGEIADYMSMNNIGDAYGINEIVGNLYFDKDAARLELDMYVNDTMKESFKKMYGKKMDKNMVRAFNHNDVLGFVSLSIDTEAMLVEYPHLMTSMYGSVLPKFKEEISVVADLISLVMDEKAIGELLTGDALFVVNDFSEKEVEYTTYEYDDDYNRKEVTKKKNELVPDASLLIGSKRKDLMNKFFKLAKKHNLIKEVAPGVFELDAKEAKVPFKFYATVQNNVVTFTTEKETAIALQRKVFAVNASKHKKILTKNSSVFYIDVKNILNKIPVELRSGKTEAKAFAFTKDNVKDAYLRVGRIKGNKVSSELSINTYGKQENTLKTILALINAVGK